MKHYPFTKFTLVSVAIGLMCIAMLVPVISSAQSPIQGANPNSSLQPQAPATQGSANTQNQEGTLQNNNGSSVLSQNGNRPLGVVSSPSQATPDAVVTPSSTTKAEISKLDNEPNLLPRILIALGTLLAAIVGIIMLRRLPRDQDQPTVPQNEFVAEKPAIRPEPLPVKSADKSRKQQRRKKKKKSSQR